MKYKIEQNLRKYEKLSNKLRFTYFILFNFKKDADIIFVKQTVSPYSILHLGYFWIKNH